MATPEQLVAALVVSFPGLAVGLERLVRLGPKIEVACRDANAALARADQAFAESVKNAAAIGLLQQADGHVKERVDDELAARRADAGASGLSSAEVENVARRVLEAELRDVRRELELARQAAVRDKENWALFLERFGELRGRIEQIARTSAL